MRLLSAFALALVLTACGSDASPDDGVSTAGPTLPSSVDATLSTGPPDPALPTGPLADIDGDWVHCAGPTALGDAAIIEGTSLRTMLDGRPGTSMPFQIAFDEMILDDGRRYLAERSGAVFTLTGDDGAAVYARTSGGCP